ncbi:eukaryotic translation initiation factor 3 subunit E (macronuclear) [Tetrahymena thermophila SB210]|uniref:Eukaryotic translation initiation factor 3 subunit E n=1 Tax=Tetrahymena thermophila (strain SB210) TaxID=312017 RepID=A4VF39_TETTS|nr:eukaryotic translation initiation factor 3 subunit E [Tetrahymena thermophila SB210]EDK31260.1 eukaryotic translation initiation factor 3 subunit E [Tetrahymena thermophila SB210]|eukprot:XP_001470651.1 eukaryotic translation initiation factor 3 subunit E [Tetrahymena thermophila SB210]
MNGELFYQQVKFLEPHLVVKICDYYIKQNTFDEQWILKEKIAALLKTRLYDQLNAEVLKLKNHQLPDLKKQIEACRLETAEQALGDKAKQFFEDIMKFYNEIEKDRFKASTITKLCGDIKFGLLRKLAQYSFILYDVGNYDVSLKIINCIYSLLQNHQDDQSILNILWGKIGCELYVQKFDEAKETIRAIRKELEKEEFSGHFQIYNRAYLIYHAIYAYFQPKSTESDFEAFIELITGEQYVATIQMVCSEVIRYHACALLLTRSNQYHLTQFLNSFQKGVFDYKDNLIEFLKLTLIDFQFNAAEQTLKQLSNELSKDYFLSNQKEQIITAAQHLFFKSYCKVFDIVEIKMVSSFLNCSASDAETWIVNFIRVSNIDAKIDSENGIVHITKRQNNFDETINNKLREIVPRTVLLVNNMKRIIPQN